MEPLDLLAQLLNTGVDKVVDQLLLVFSGLAAVGLLAMVLLDFVKVLLQPRQFFNRFHATAEIRRGLRWRFGQADTNHVLAIENQLANLSVAGDTWLLYFLPTDECTKQIRSAVSTALADLRVYENRLIVIGWCENADSKKLDRLCEKSAELDSDDEEEDVKEKLCDSKRRALRETISRDLSYLNAMIDSNINGLQLKMSYQWKLLMLMTATVLSFSIIAIIVGASEFSTRWMAFAVVGGLLAPFAHDIVTSLAKVKNRARF